MVMALSTETSDVVCGEKFQGVLFIAIYCKGGSSVGKETAFRALPAERLVKPDRAQLLHGNWQAGLRL